jgi:hypothetical protein
LRSGIISVDDGGSSTCVVTKNNHEVFPSVKGLYGERTLTETSSKYDYVVEYEGDIYAMGTLAKYDCKYPLKMHTQSKQHIFFDLSVLVAIHQFGYDNNYLITSVPIGMHKEGEKRGRIDRLRGEKTITVNGVTKTFWIRDVKIAAETAVAFWVDEPQGKNRFIDLGSRTIGYATTIYENNETRFVDDGSGTIMGKGLEALGNSYNQAALADLICGELSINWSSNDNVFLLGGGAMDDKLVDNIRRYFPKAEPLGNPVMSNALGMFLLGRVVYDGMD